MALKVIHSVSVQKPTSGSSETKWVQHTISPLSPRVVHTILGFRTHSITTVICLVEMAKCLDYAASRKEHTLPSWLQNFEA